MENAVSKIINSIKGINKHIKMIFFTVLIGGMFIVMRRDHFFSDKSLFLLSLIFIQMEFFFWLGKSMFSFSPGKTPREITWNIVVRYLLYYLSCLIFAAISYVVLLGLLYIKNNTPLKELLPNFLRWEFQNWFIGTNIGLTFGAFVFFLLQWQEALKREHCLKEEKLNFKYETLNKQVDPHFLFNSLNTLSSFIATKPDVAEKYVIKLASVYRYIIDNVGKNKISLADEIQFIQDYFYLHKLRDGDKIQLKIDILVKNEYMIIPVSLQILIENALKHNIAMLSSPLNIEVFMEDSMVVVKNNLQKMSSLDMSPKKGLRNLKERIFLTTGKNIDVKESSRYYLVKIPLII